MPSENDVALVLGNGRRKGRKEGMAVAADAMTPFLVLLLLPH